MNPPSTGSPAFLALVGPTASGKTRLSLALAGEVDGEIISMDSRQVYRGMDVGTAKVGSDERSRVPHHGLDVVNPDRRYSAGQFARDARAWIDEIRSRGRTPILVGGTGFFLRALMEPIFTEPALDADRLEGLRRYLAGQPREKLEAWVRRLDPERADLAVEGGPHRITRTLEVALLSGRRLSRLHREAPPDGEGSEGVVVVLTLPRDELYRRIDARVGVMIDHGLVDEVRGLMEAGYGEDAPGMTGTGYREVARHLSGEWTLDEAIEAIQRNTRRYARRQLTWFRHQLPEGTPRVDATRPLDEQVHTVLQAWREG